MRFVSGEEVDSCQDEAEMSQDENEPGSTKISHKRVVKTGTTIFVPHDILKSPLSVSTANMNNINPTAISATIHSVIAACSGDTNKVNLHRSQSYRYRVESILEDIKGKWIPPVVGNLHWDGKLMHSRKIKHEDAERLQVLVYGAGGVKLLGVPGLPTNSNDRAGTIIPNVTHEPLLDWKCAECIACMVFDTTSANTGHITAACISLLNKLERQLLCCACRHHVGEVILTRVWNDLNIETSKGPNIATFERLI